MTKDAKEAKYLSLFICGRCGKKDEDIDKVVLANYANMLCCSCKAELNDAIADVARRYLTTNRKLLED